MSTAPHALVDPARSAPPAALKRAEVLAAVGLREAVARLHPDLARICGYHFGWCDSEGQESGSGTGKLLRASLVLLSAEASGSATEAVVPAAVAVELVHNFSLLHDDIMDADEMRRGRAAAWVAFGSGMSTLAGDALIAAALRCSESLPAGPGRILGDLLIDTLDRMIRGQAADVALEGGDVTAVRRDHYLQAAEKTTALMEGSLAVGALMSGAPAETVLALRLAGRHLGLSWQIANDVEDIWGDPAVTGKPARSDLRRRKKTIPVILVLESGGEAAAALAESLRTATADRSDEQLRVEADLIDRAGGRHAAERLSREHLEVAMGHLHAAPLVPRIRAELLDLFRFVVGRGV